MNLMKLGLGVIIFGVITYAGVSFSSLATKSKVDFDKVPKASIVKSGTVDVISGDGYRFHVLKDTGAYTATIIESATGVVLVDTGTADNPAFGIDIAAYIKAIGKPSSAIITHDHGDHYGNLGLQSNIEALYAGAQVAASLDGNDEFREVTKANITYIKDNATIYGLTYKFSNVSETENSENSFFSIDSANALFVGDLLYVNAHNYIRRYTPLDGNDELDNWITALESLKTSNGDYSHVFVGHNGYSSNLKKVIDDNINYLSTAQSLIKGTEPLRSGKKANSVEDVVNEMKRLYPDHKGRAVELALPGAFWDEDPGAIWFN